MDKNYVVEGNKILAYYMGYEYIPHNNPYDWKPGWWKRTTHPRFRYAGADSQLNKFSRDHYLGRKHSDLRFYNSWDSLMKVLDKFEEEGYRTSLKTDYVRLNPIEGDYYHYIVKVNFNSESYTVNTNTPNGVKLENFNQLFGKLEPINKLQAVFIMLVESIKILQPEIIEKIKL